MDLFITPAYAQSVPGGSGLAEMMVSIFPILLVFGIFYFIVFRPQQQRVKQHKEMILAVRRNDTVVTAGGIIGKVTKVVDDHEVLVEISENTRVRVLKSTISDVRSKTEPVKDK